MGIETIYQQTLLNLYAEAFGLAPEASATFLDSGTAGFFGVLADVDATTASGSLKAGNATLAAHCWHVTWLLETAVRQSDREQFEPDWGESWAVSTVDAAAWATLRQTMRHHYDALVTRLGSRRVWSDDDVAGSLTTLTHVVYHLGEIKQMLSAM